MTQAIPRGQTGLALVLRCLRTDGTLENLATATNLEILLRGPNGVTQTKQASLTSDGTDAQMQYVTQSGDLDDAGEWEYQGRFTKDGGTRWTHRAFFRVDPTL